MSHRTILAAAVAVAAAVLAWVLFVALPRRYTEPASQAVSAAPSPTTPPGPGRKIKAHLYYVGEDGTRLTAVDRDVPYGEGPAAQARAIVEAQIAPVADPLVSAIPAGTKLRALFITDRGDAYVDLSGEIAAGHPGGSIDELLTIYTIVDALTANLPAVSSVQVLVDGHEVDTLAGHVDLRRPLTKNLQWVE